MATESPIRIMEESGKWASQATFQELGLVLKGQKFQEKQRNLGPNRSGSAPPSMEGSFAAIENLMSKHKIAANATPNEEQLRADPSYFEYYSTHVNLNPRLPPPIISEENRHLFRNIAGTGNNPRFTTFDDFARLTQSGLSTHREDSDDDQSSKPAGGLDSLTLNSLYDEGAYRASQQPVYGSPTPNPFEVSDPFNYISVNGLT